MFSTIADVARVSEGNGVYLNVTGLRPLGVIKA
jgi:hypothetical protein